MTHFCDLIILVLNDLSGGIMIDNTNGGKTHIQAGDSAAFQSLTSEIAFRRPCTVLDFDDGGEGVEYHTLYLIKSKRDFVDLCNFIALMHGLKASKIRANSNSNCWYIEFD